MADKEDEHREEEEDEDGEDEEEDEDDRRDVSLSPVYRYFSGCNSARG